MCAACADWAWSPHFFFDVAVSRGLGLELADCVRCDRAFVSVVADSARWCCLRSVRSDRVFCLWSWTSACGLALRSAGRSCGWLVARLAASNQEFGSDLCGVCGLHSAVSSISFFLKFLSVRATSRSLRIGGVFLCTAAVQRITGYPRDLAVFADSVLCSASAAWRSVWSRRARQSWRTRRNKPPPRSHEAYFGNGFSHQIDIHRGVPGGAGGWFWCFHSATLRSSKCEGGRLWTDPSKIKMSVGGEG
ncbi:hypothetical protein KSP39_PZI006506 [Platanthera zijinensis]|uniref:Uncharacterized protein n=1 Tax=Platanthera zijinensis TaxID=2320716 RepID=A0AAP0G9T3_9ASPA